MIYATGDTHAPIDIRKLNTKNFPEQKEMTKSDYLIILGDFGLWWGNNIKDKTEMYWRKWLNDKKFTTLFLDGNHENHRRLHSGVIAPEVINGTGYYSDSRGYLVEKKFSGYVGRIAGSIYHLRRGEVYTIEGKKFFVMGGAESVDKLSRTEGRSWWREEVPNNKEFYYGLDNLDAHNRSVDYILGHTAPESIINKYLNKNYYGVQDPVTKFFDRVIETTQF